MSERLSYWILFIINPFTSMVYAFLDYTKPYSKNIFWAFCTFYGLTFTIGQESRGSDINRYVRELSQLHEQSSLTIVGAVEYFKNSGEIDILRTLLSYFVSRFTDSQAILTMVYAFIFGYFFSRNIWYIFGLLKNKMKPITKLVLFTLVLVMPIWHIGGFRMWTAFHVFLFGLLPFIIENKKKNLIFLFLSFLVHFSYMIPIAIFLLYLIIGNRVKLYFVAFTISFFISELNINSINNVVNNFFPEILLERTSSYLFEAKVETFREATQNLSINWYAVWNMKALRWGLAIVLFYLFFYSYKYLIVNPKIKRLFSISLLMFTVANILMSLPSGSRFLYLAFFITLVLIVIYQDNYYQDRNFSQVLMLISPALILFAIVSIRIGLYATSITSVLGNPFFAIMSTGDNISLNDLIK